MKKFKLQYFKVMGPLALMCSLLLGIICACSKNEPQPKDSRIIASHMDATISLLILDKEGNNLLDPKVNGSISTQNISVGVIYSGRFVKDPSFVNFEIRHTSTASYLSLSLPTPKYSNSREVLKFYVQFGNNNPLDTFEVQYLYTVDKESMGTYGNSSLIKQHIWLNGAIVWVLNSDLLHQITLVRAPMK